MRPANPPQLQNAGIWKAPPILISGASAYRDGEYLYQDFLYDDHGADGTTPDANQPDETVANALARPAGTYTYPTDPKYGGNAADLVEFRLKPTADATAFRVTLNTMLDPTLYAFTIGLGNSKTAFAMPHGANATEPAQVFLTVHGTTADLVNAASGKTIGTKPVTVSVDMTRRQVTVLLPYADYDTRHRHALRVAIATGLWDNTAQTYLLPSITSSATVPGGAGTLTSPPAFFNVGFRHREPAMGANDPTSQTSYWRESQQSSALASGDLSAFFDRVDMDKVAAGANDDMPGQIAGVPFEGHIDRILPSHFEPFQGRMFTGCSGTSAACPAEYGNALQPYAVYVPRSPAPKGGYPLTLLLHSLSVNYNQYQNTHNESQFSRRAGGSLVFTVEGRGPDNWYYDLGEADVFEAWADIEQHYPIDDNSVALTGYSMGGYATFKLGTQFPDLFGIMQPTVGPAYVATGGGGPTDTKPMLPTLRNIPLLSWHASADELVQTPFALEEEQDEAADGLNFEWDLFSPAEHLTLAINDQFDTAAKFLGDPKNDPNPPHVTFVRNPSMDDAAHGIVADHAYWLSNVSIRTASDTTGEIDVLSKGFGLGDPPTSGTAPVEGTLTGGTIPALAYTGFKNSYGKAPREPVADALVITATNIKTATISPARAKIDCAATLQVTTDGPLDLQLAGCSRGSHAYARGRTYFDARTGTTWRAPLPVSHRL
jgi:pimeloyl-ACP methyl ester carboxylesterase